MTSRTNNIQGNFNGQVIVHIIKNQKATKEIHKNKFKPLFVQINEYSFKENRAVTHFVLDMNCNYRSLLGSLRKLNVDILLGLLDRWCPIK